MCAGEGSTSEGEFWESMNTACNLKLPIIFLIQDNEYAISVPVEINTAGGSISKLLGSFPNLLIQEGILDWGGFHAELLRRPVDWEEGYILPPTGPGLGVELDEAVAEAHPYTGPELHMAPGEQEPEV